MNRLGDNVRRGVSVLGRVRSLVKGSTPRAGVKDYRFFVDPLSSLPPEMGEGPRFGFTGFMSRSGYGFNAFAGEEESLARLQEDWAVLS